MDRFCEKRNITSYEFAELMFEREAKEMHDLATDLRDRVLDCLKERYSKLLKS